MASDAPVRRDRSERRVVTCLFCDVVAFTTLSEASDPEDVDRMLSAYFGLARAAIERHGGVVEKFIGDAVVGVFGAPVTHEDDPARAVRAGLEICRGARRLRTAGGAPLRLRVGVNTGEVLVHLDARPAAGEPMLVGDAVNTAARIQTAAPELGVAVGDRTWGATRLGFDYEELPPATLKGKAGTTRLFHARSERVISGADAARTHAGRYVGRQPEVERLRAAYLEVQATRRTRLAVIVGEPGIGKSRLLSELGADVRSIDIGARWHQGRCLPYGDGTGFWALGEVVKSYAGILEGDDAATARAQLAATIAGVREGAWLQERLEPLLGLGGGTGVAREEQFAAWARYLRSMAGSGTAVIALEDVHWADAALLAFLDVLTEPADAALLVVLTTRPSITDMAPDLGARAERPVRLDLEPLSNQETQALVVDLLGSIVPSELHAPILERSRGNPLYAEELVRLLGDRDLLERTEGIIRLRPGVTIPLPETIHGLLASRLDAVPEAERSVLSRAAIVGATFWPAAIAAIGGTEPADVRGALDALERRQLVRRHEPSSLAGEDEFEFWHVLLRDVAYEALPRRDRIEGHLATVDWIEATTGRHDVEGIVAHHLATACDLALAVADGALVDELRPRARTAFWEAAEAASAMDAAAALPLYRRALDLATPGDADRAGLLLGFGRVAERAGRIAESIASLDEALAILAASGEQDTPAAAEVMVALQRPLIDAVDDRWLSLAARAVEILEPRGPSPLLVAALVGRAWAGLWESPPVAAREYADRALSVAAAAGLATPVEALAIRGQMRITFDDMDAGFADFERAFETAVDRGEWEAAGTIPGNYAGYLYFHHGVARADALTVRALALCDAHGLRTMASWYRLSHAHALIQMGRLADGEAVVGTMADDGDTSGNRLATNLLLVMRTDVALIRDDRDRLLAMLPALDRVAAADNSTGLITDVVIRAAQAHERVGDRDGARPLLLKALAADRTIDRYWMDLAATTRLALALGEVQLAVEVPTGVSSRSLVQRLGHRTNAALVAQARGAHEDAAAAFGEVANGWGEFGNVLECGLAHVGAAQCLMAIGSVDAVRPSLEAGRQVFTNLGSPIWLRSVAEISEALDSTAVRG